MVFNWLKNNTVETNVSDVQRYVHRKECVVIIHRKERERGSERERERERERDCSYDRVGTPFLFISCCISPTHKANKKVRS